MRCSLNRLKGRGYLRVCSREQTSHLLGYRLVPRKPGELILPELEVTSGKLVEVGAGISRRVVVFGGHRLL